MNYSHPFLTLEQPCDKAIAWVVNQVSEVGLQVIRTFDLQAARHNRLECHCPHHGIDPCDCQMVVLLVYGNESIPISLIAHSVDGRTWFSLVDNPQQRADPQLEHVIRQIFPR